MDKDTQQAFEHAVILGKPAYGRNYNSAKRMLEDWYADKDFTNVTPGVGGKYFNRQDVEKLGIDEVILSNRDESITCTCKPKS